jgi:hypothetical protein
MMNENILLLNSAIDSEMRASAEKILQLHMNYARETQPQRSPRQVPPDLVPKFNSFNWL